MKRRVFVITNPMTPLNKSSEVTTSKFLRTISGYYNLITVIGGNASIESDLTDVNVVTYPFEKRGSIAIKVLGMIKLQYQIARYMIKNVKRGDAVIFWLGDKMILPYIVSKMRTSRVGYFIYGNLEAEGGSIFMRISARLVTFMANKANRVFVESISVKDGWHGRIKKEVSELHLYSDVVQYNDICNRQNKVGMLCRIANVKHVIEAIHAFVELHEDYPQWSLEIIGSGVQEKECKELIKALRAEEYITLFGWLDRRQISMITDMWKYNMLVSDHEGLPNSMIEMLAKGVPIIATPVGGIPDFLKDKESGFVLEGTTVEAVKVGLKRAFETDNYEQMTKTAFRSVEARFSLEGAQKNANQVLENW